VICQFIFAGELKYELAGPQIFKYCARVHVS
jgi:hypothetical protein